MSASENGHTGGHMPGPWDFDGATNQARSHQVTRTIFAANGDGVAEIYDHFRGEADANARLISAAPEMLEALKEVPDPADFANADDYREAINLWWVAFAKPSISKATGAA